MKLEAPLLIESPGIRWTGGWVSPRDSLVKVNVKLSLIKHHVMKTYVGAEA
jgi:hypothetical protein